MPAIARYAMRNLNAMSAVDDLVLAARDWDAGDHVVLDMGRVRTTWPNTTAYFSSVLAYLRRERGISFAVDRLHPNQAKVRLVRPGSIDDLEPAAHPTNTVWEYSSEEEAHKIADHFMSSLTDMVVCQAGVIDAFNWCLFEVLDNVFQHSQAASGFVMMQVHIANRTCVIAVTDSGRGIHRAMVDAAQGSSVDRTRVVTADAAIAHALEQGVTSKGKLNQGNGLHGLRRAVGINGGQLTVQSGRGTWRYEHGAESTSLDMDRPLLDRNASHSTTVDWRLDCARPVSINEALGRPEQPSPFLETIEVSAHHYRIDAAELEALVGSRAQGTEVRNRILNYLAAGAREIVLDLTGLPIVSSSFADEVLGKLALEMGELEYRRRIFLDGASATNRGLIERAIELRLQAGV